MPAPSTLRARRTNRRRGTPPSCRACRTSWASRIRPDFRSTCLLGYAWSHAVPLGTIAFGMNAMSGVAMAAAGGAAYACALEFGALAADRAAGDAVVCVRAGRVVARQARRSAGSRGDVRGVCGVRVPAMDARGRRPMVCARRLRFGLGIAAHPNAIWLVPGFVAGAIVANAPALDAVNRRIARANGLRSAAVPLSAAAFGIRRRARSRSDRTCCPAPAAESSGTTTIQVRRPAWCAR